MSKISPISPEGVTMSRRQQRPRPVSTSRNCFGIYSPCPGSGLIWRFVILSPSLMALWGHAKSEIWHVSALHLQRSKLPMTMYFFYEGRGFCFWIRDEDGVECPGFLEPEWWLSFNKSNSLKYGVNPTEINKKRSVFPDLVTWPCTHFSSRRGEDGNTIKAVLLSSICIYVHVHVFKFFRFDWCFIPCTSSCVQFFKKFSLYVYIHLKKTYHTTYKSLRYTLIFWNVKCAVY